MNIMHLTSHAGRAIEAWRSLPAVLSAAFLLTACSSGAVAPSVADTADDSNAQSQSASRKAGTNAPSLSDKIYVANVGNQTVTTYRLDGTQTTPTIATGSGSTDYLWSVAVDSRGKIYALNFDPLVQSNAIVTTFKPDGSPTTPTITLPIRLQPYTFPQGITVDANGKIYVLSSDHNGSPGTVFSFKPDGTPTAPTFATGGDSSSITVDGNGKIYVANQTGTGGKASVTTYRPDGTPTTPTITRDISQPSGVAVDASGKIYVANADNRGRDGTLATYVTIYNSDGSGPLLSIKVGAGAPGGLGIDANGKIYVATGSAYTSTVKTYTAEGTRTTPTIHAGVNQPSAMVIH
jgi:sugar lactone lactonase YvrE